MLQSISGSHTEKDLSYSTTTKFATHRGQRIAYRVAGTGPQAVVLQHGFLGRKEHYLEYQEAFERAGFTVIVVDSLGHGESDKRRAYQ